MKRICLAVIEVVNGFKNFITFLFIEFIPKIFFAFTFRGKKTQKG